MIAFLEFVCEKLMGPPLRPGHWCCPFHDDDNPSFSVRPPAQRPDGGWFPIKFKCHGCAAWGDEWDMIVRFYPDDTRKQQTDRWSTLRDEYEKLTGKSASQYSTSPSPGKRGLEVDDLNFCLAELKSVLRERKNEWPREELGLRILVWASAVAEENGVALEALVRHCASDLIQSRGAAKC